MPSLFKKHPVAVSLSVIFHLFLVAIFFVGFDFFEPEIQKKPVVNIVKATVIDESKIRAEAEKLKKLEQKKKRLEKEQLDKLKQQRREDKHRKEQKKQALEKKLEQKKAKQEAEQAALKKQAELLKKKALIKKKKAEELRVKKQLAEKQKKAKIAQQKKRATEKLEKQRLDKERLAKEQAIREKALLEDAEREEQEMLAQTAIDSFRGIIRQKVERNWIQPTGSIAGLSCVVQVNLIPGGEVIKAKVIKSSGNSLFDSSVERAAQKASPLPLPDDPALFNYFRTLEFHFQPGDS